MFEQALAKLQASGLQRQRQIVQAIDGPELVVNSQTLLAFCSNDYLGLMQHPALIEAAQTAARQYGVGAGAAPLVSGHSALHEAAEQALAQFVGQARALYFGSGYLANVGIIPALVDPQDAVFSDALNHACLIDGIRLSKAHLHIYPHGDVSALAQALAHSTAPKKLVVTDAVFSMDGDLAPLPELLALCEHHGAWLLIDDAHGFGVLGPQGQGSAAHFGLQSDRLIYMATLGKAAGCAGAFVAGQASLIEWLMQRARSYLFATAAPAMIMAAVLASVQVLKHEDWRRTHLRERIEQLRQGLASTAWHHSPCPTAIQPIIVGDNQAALHLMNRLKSQGLWVPAIRPPTVPEGTARLRISLCALHSQAHVQRLLTALGSGQTGET